ncbi:MAG TPA: hypothetical protein DCG85_07960 [Lachnospiraceae bacterium]|nr:hypothetical protein [Lachnospiraceae bacterium]
MRIGIDLTFIRPDHTNGGTESVIKNLMKGIERLQMKGEMTDEVLFFIHTSLYKEYRRTFPSLKFKPYKMPGKHALRMILFQTLYLPKLANKEGIDVMFFPTFQTGLNRFDMPVVCDPNDIQFRYYPDNFSKAKWIYYHIFYKSSLKKASRIIYISDYVKGSYEKYYKRYIKDKGVTLYTPIDFRLLSKEQGMTENLKKMIKPGDYILSINSLQKHKNLITLLRAYERYINDFRDKGEIPEKRLILAGARCNSANEIDDFIESHDLTDFVTVTGFLKEEEIAWLYQNASLFITTSTYEGFGMTPVEAMAAKCPVISSTETSLPEATLNMVTYYENAYDDRALYEAIKSELAIKRNTPKEMKAINERREAVESKYNIDKVTADYLRVIREAAGVSDASGVAGDSGVAGIQSDTGVAKKGKNEDEEDLYRGLYRYSRERSEENGKKMPGSEEEFIEYVKSNPETDRQSLKERAIALSGIRNQVGLRKIAKKLPQGVQDKLRRVFS